MLSNDRGALALTATTLAQILRDSSTILSQWGKVAPGAGLESSEAGRSTIGRCSGFEHYYGFLGG